ncbi:MAG: hypothetical protein V3U92_14435 [Cellulophaga sp.]
MDDFEKHIKENKEVFDTHSVDKAILWNAILSKMDKPKVIPLWKRPSFNIAASVLFLVGIFSILRFFAIGGLNYETQETVVNKELQDVNMHYKSLVAYQVKLVMDNSKLTIDDKNEFLLFMDELDEEYKILELEMNKNLDNTIVLEAIVSNYKKRIELIENLLQLLNNSKKTQSSDEYIL